MQKDLHAGENQEDPEYEKEPPEFCNKRASQSNEDRPQCECSKDAPEQHTVLVLDRDGKTGKQHRPHENVVDTQGFFDEITADVFTKRSASKREGHNRGER